MKVYSMREAKNQFFHLIHRVLKGEEAIITKSGKPVARILPITTNIAPRKPGGDRGKVIIKPDFDAPLEEF